MLLVVGNIPSLSKIINFQVFLDKNIEVLFSPPPPPSIAFRISVPGLRPFFNDVNKQNNKYTHFIKSSKI